MPDTCTKRLLTSDDFCESGFELVDGKLCPIMPADCCPTVSVNGSPIAPDLTDPTAPNYDIIDCCPTVSIGGVPIVADSGSPVGAPNFDITCDLLKGELDKCFGPTAYDDSYTTPLNTPITADASLGDTEDFNTAGGTYQLVADNTGGNGTLAFGANGTFTFTPTTGFCGEVTFTYTCTDAEGNVSNVATETITVECGDPIARTTSGYAGNGVFTETVELLGCGGVPAVTGDCVTIEWKDNTNGGIVETWTGKVGDNIQTFTSSNSGPSALINFVGSTVVTNGATYSIDKKSRWHSQPSRYQDANGATRQGVQQINNPGHAGYNPIELQSCITITPVGQSCGTSSNTDNFDVIGIICDFLIGTRGNLGRSNNVGYGGGYVALGNTTTTTYTHIELQDKENQGLTGQTSYTEFGQPTGVYLPNPTNGLDLGLAGEFIDANGLYSKRREAHKMGFYEVDYRGYVWVMNADCSVNLEFFTYHLSSPPVGEVPTDMNYELRGIAAVGGVIASGATGVTAQNGTSVITTAPLDFGMYELYTCSESPVLHPTCPRFYYDIETFGLFGF